MATGQITPASRILVSSDRITTGTSHGTTLEAFTLVSDQGNPGWDLLLEPWDLVINTTDGNSAHIVDIPAVNKASLDADIFTAITKSFVIVRGSEFRLIFPQGLNYEFFSIQARSKKGNAIQGVEVHTFNNDNSGRSALFSSVFGDGMDANGILEKVGRNIQATFTEGIIVVNYIESNILVKIEGIDVTLQEFA